LIYSYTAFYIFAQNPKVFQSNIGMKTTQQAIAISNKTLPRIELLCD